jgi:glycosyltransferase involved in cell wall biosynthesis
MATAVIAFFQAYPPKSGGAQVAYNVAKYCSPPGYLLQSAPYDVKPSLVDNLTIQNLGRLSENKICRTVQVWRQSRRLIQMLAEIKPDVIILEGAASLYCLIALYAIRRRGITTTVVYHAHNVECLLRQERGNRLYSRIAKWAEGVLMRKADVSSAVSQVDAANFKKMYGVEPVLLPNGVDVDMFANVSLEQIQEVRKKYGLNRKTVLFMGMPSYPPNREGIAFLLHNIFPAVIQEYAEARLVMIGGRVPYSREWLINPGRIPFDELAAFVRACDVCVAPIFSGSGTRVKILEYFGAAKPVVATAKAAEGIAVKHNETVIIAESAQEHVAGILSLLRNPVLADTLGSRALELVKVKYAWKSIMQEFERGSLSTCCRCTRGGKAGGSGGNRWNVR